MGTSSGLRHATFVLHEKLRLQRCPAVEGIEDSRRYRPCGTGEGEGRG